jgi:hypothetical protein
MPAACESPRATQAHDAAQSSLATRPLKLTQTPHGERARGEGCIAAGKTRTRRRSLDALYPALMNVIVLTLGRVLPLCLFVLLTACQSTGPTADPPTPARPAVTLGPADPDRIREVAQRLFEERGYEEAASPLREVMIFDRPQSEAPNRALRVRLRLIPHGRDGWQLTGVPLGVERWRTALEMETVLEVGYPQIQNLLEMIQRRLEEGAP